MIARRRVRTRLLAALAVAALFAPVATSAAASQQAASSAAASAQAAGRPPTFVIDGDPNSLDTIRNTPFGWLLGPLTQGYLFLVDERGRLVPDRALRLPSRENGLISPDGRTITYEIRTGRWSDGAPFDARDVAFTVAALLNPRTSVPDTSAVAPIAAVTVPRPDRLVVRLKRPFAPFVSSFLSLGANDPFAILPRHIAAGYGSLDDRPVGLGPFQLAAWRRGERLDLERMLSITMLGWFAQSAFLRIKYSRPLWSKFGVRSYAIDCGSGPDLLLEC